MASQAAPVGKDAAAARFKAAAQADRIVREKKALEVARAKQLKDAQKAIDNARNDVTKYSKEAAAWVKLYNSYKQLYGPNPNSSQQAQLTQLENSGKIAFQKEAQARNALSNATSAKFKLEQSINRQIAIENKKPDDAKTRVQDAKGNKKDKGDVPAPKGPTARPSYIYNAPMIKFAYFNGSGPGVKYLKSKTNNPAAVTDALKGFQAAKNTKGFIQMSSETAFWMAKETAPGTGGTYKTLKPYGFRFHYNPGAVSQTYGGLGGKSQELAMSGIDQLNPVTPLDTQTTFSFDLYLNRIEDMNFVNKVSDTTTGDGIFRSTDLYGETVSPEDLKGIWNKGTMYDIEHLFKAVHGGQGIYKSILRGETADIGWLNGIAVEFHLGKGLRYLGRISSFSMKHIQFTENMVPTLTIVSVSAQRFYDFPTGKLGKK
jgi:uncharacterized membrane-anchored protein YhcB (DUF1043 family)